MTFSNKAPEWTIIEVADTALCADACREIYVQRPLWRAWCLNGQPTFYTLGAASYLELGFAGRSTDEYLGAAGSLWRWAGDAVRSIVERVRDALENYLDARVEYPTQLPPPGFHIFIGAAIPQTDCARNVADCSSSHFDMQYEHIPWNRWYSHVDVERTISFTLALKLPTAGGGLTLWESLTLKRMRKNLATQRFFDIPSAANATSCSLIPYAVGSMVVHNGHLLHQMTGVPRTRVTDERITLQGHGVLADGVWRLYW